MIVGHCTDNIVYVTQGDTVLCNFEANVDNLAPCNHEEADTWISKQWIVLFRKM